MSGSHVGAFAHGGASVACGGNLLGTVDGAGLFTAGGSIRSSVSVTQIVGLVANNVLESAASIAAISVAIAPFGGSSETP